MISLYIRPDKTQVVKAELKKDRRLYVSDASEFASYWEALTGEDMSLFNTTSDLLPDAGKESFGASLSDMFAEVRDIVPCAGQDFYIVLPDELFQFIDCLEVPRENIASAISERLQKDESEFYYSVPVINNVSNQEPAKSVYVIDRTYVQALIDAAAEEGIRLSSIEPASISFLRANQYMDENEQEGLGNEEFLLEIFANSAKFISYSPAKGIFALQAEGLSENELRANTPEDNRRIIDRQFTYNDFTAQESFISLNDGVPYIVLTETPNIKMQFAQRAASQKHFPPCIDARIAPEYQQEWMCVIGTLMQDYTLEDVLYDGMPDYVEFLSANVLPETFQINAKFWRWKQKVKKICRGVIVTSVAVGVLEAGLSLYFNSTEVPQSLQADYAKAEGDMDAINNEVSIINTATKEHEFPVEAFAELLRNKPNNCGFAKVNFGSKNSGGGSDADKKWIEFTAVSTDPLVFQDYTAALSDDSMFNGVSITQITNEQASSIKTATFVARKGKI